MLLRTKTLIIIFAAFFLLLVLSTILLFKPIMLAINLLSQNKNLLTQGFNVIKVNDELKKAIERKTDVGIDVLHYLINVDLYPENKTIKGDVVIKMSLGGNKSDKVNLDFYENMLVKEVTVDNKISKFSRDEKTLSIYKENNNNDTVDIRIVYEGSPQNLGFGSFSFPKVGDKKFVYTMNEPIYASTWLPCVDIPTDKALSDINITNDSSMISLSNGKLINTTTNGSRRTYHWKTIYPISTYLIALYSANYKTFSQKYVSVSKDTVDLICYATPDKFEDIKKDFSDHISYMKIFEDLFGPYPFSKEKYGLAEFWWSYGAMESQTITGIGSKYINGRKFFADMLIHELAHHWWGNAVTPKSWKDIWLNEGFATYSEALYFEKRSGFTALQSTLDQKFDTFDNGTLYNPIDNLFSRMIYDKGGWVLHMLRKELGDKIFFTILKSYFEKYKYSNASTEDFKKLCEKVSGKNLNRFFDQWIYKGEGIIISEYDWTVVKSGEDYSVKLEVKQTQEGYDVYEFPLDIKIFFENGEEPVVVSKYIKHKNETFLLDMKSKPRKILFDPDKWLLAIFNQRES